MSESRYCFITTFYDLQADLNKTYHLFYFENNTIELYDPKLGKNFLKRCVYPSLSLSDFRIGNTVTIYSRQYKIVSYADDYTKNSLEVKQQRQVVIVKQKDVDNLGMVMEKLIVNSFIISRCKMIRLNSSQSELIVESNSAEIANVSIVVLELVASNIFEKLSTLNLDLVYPNNKLDLFKLSNNNNLNNTSLLLIKPHAVLNGFSGKIIDVLLHNGFDINALELRCLKVNEASEFLEVYKNVLIEYSAMVSQYSSGPLLALAVSSPNSVTDLRKLSGPSDPDVAKVLRPNTLRAKFGVNKIENAVHCTDLEEDGSLEVQYFFSILPKANGEI